MKICRCGCLRECYFLRIICDGCKNDFVDSCAIPCIFTEDDQVYGYLCYKCYYKLKDNYTFNNVDDPKKCCETYVIHNTLVLVHISSTLRLFCN